MSIDSTDVPTYAADVHGDQRADLDRAAMLEREIHSWLCRYIGQLTCQSPNAVDVDAAFSRLGLDSVAILALTGDLGTWLGREIDEAMAYEYPSIVTLSRAVAEGSSTYA